MDDHRTGFKHNDDVVVPWRSRVPPGVPGAGWFVTIFFVFAVFMFTGWGEGWWEADHRIAGAPTGSYHTTGSGNRVPH